MGLIFGRSTSAKDAWNKAKKEFETKTGKKKPSQKFLGAFRKSSGIESAIDDLDQIRLKLWDAKTQKDFDKVKVDFNKSCQKLSTVTNAYVKVLEASADGDFKDFKPDVIILRDALLKEVKYYTTIGENRNGFK